MGIYASKHLIFAPTCSKYDLIILNKCMQYHQLRTNSTLAGVIVLTMHAVIFLYGSYITATLYKQLDSRGASITMLLLFSLFLCLCIVYNSLYSTILQFLKSCLVSISECHCVHYYRHLTLCSLHQFPSL